MSSGKKNKVEIEDLLKLKRHEQPSKEFWDGFNDQLRQKTLNTLSEKACIFKRIRVAWDQLMSSWVPAVAIPLLVFSVFMQIQFRFHDQDSSADLCAAAAVASSASFHSDSFSRRPTLSSEFVNARLSIVKDTSSALDQDVSPTAYSPGVINSSALTGYGQNRGYLF